MKLVGSRNQTQSDHLYVADITMTGSAQLVLPQQPSRSMLILQNLGAHAMYVEFGSARAHCAITNGVVTSVTIDNGGFGFTLPPIVEFMGGGGVTPAVGLSQPGGWSPQRPAQGTAVLSGNSVASITINDGGSGYLKAPYVFMWNQLLDPNGCATPSSTSGLLLQNTSATLVVAPIIFNGTDCPTDPIAVLGTSSDVLLCRWME